MEAYDAAVLSYALATAANKIKPGLLPSVANSTLQKFGDDVSLTPPARLEQRGENIETTGQLYQLLCNLEQLFINRGVAQLTDLLELCSCKQVSRICFICAIIKFEWHIAAT